MLQDVLYGRPRNFFQDFGITFIALYGTEVTNIPCIAHHSMFWGICRRDVKSFAKYFAGSQESLGLFQSLAICSVADKSTINTRFCGNASVLMI